jgi:uncharacterized membrane protein
MSESSLQMILDKIETMELNLQERAVSQEKYWDAKYNSIETIATKAHSRLDDHKKEITTLCDWRHRITGAMWIVPIVLSLLTVILTTWLLTIFGAVNR